MLVNTKSIDPIEEEQKEYETERAREKDSYLLNAKSVCVSVKGFVRNTLTLHSYTYRNYECSLSISPLAYLLNLRLDCCSLIRGALGV